MREEQREWPTNAKGLTFDPLKGRIMLFKSTIETLGTPEYFRFLFNPAKRKFAVQACSIKDEGADRMPKLREGDCCYISCNALVQYVFSTCKWDSDFTHRVEGVFHSEENLVEFDLTHSWELRWEKTENEG